MLKDSKKKQLSQTSAEVEDEQFEDVDGLFDIQCQLADHHQQMVNSICTYEFCTEYTRQMCGLCFVKVHKDHQNDSQNQLFLENLNNRIKEFKDDLNLTKRTLKQDINSIIDTLFENYFRFFKLQNTSKEQFYETISTKYNKYFYEMISNVMDKIDSILMNLLSQNKQSVKFLRPTHEIKNFTEYKIQSDSKNMVLIEMSLNLEKKIKFELRLQDNIEYNQENKNCFLGFIDRQVVNRNQMRFVESQGPYQIMYFYGVLETQQGKQLTDIDREVFSSQNENLLFTYQNNELTIEVKNTKKQKIIKRPQNTSLYFGTIGKMTVNLIPLY